MTSSIRSAGFGDIVVVRNPRNPEKLVVKRIVATEYDHIFSDPARSFSSIEVDIK
ncbi:hypothetical protein BB560_001944 [Smittium megazygosporum]|uniref:Peptidase S26 domain-containing protein n=1 Tax=Smittium megazygosporum TaxID=133381 RepID=A0A2T9ZG82_9FUNG|nr:hypothetical protein BB560_001944 [Smittium megazygosporum]